MKIIDPIESTSRAAKDIWVKEYTIESNTFQILEGQATVSARHPWRQT